MEAIKGFISNPEVEEYKAQLFRCAFAMGSYCGALRTLIEPSEESKETLLAKIKELSEQVTKDVNYLFYEERK